MSKEEIRKLIQEFLLDWWSEEDCKNDIVDKLVEDLYKVHKKEIEVLLDIKHEAWRKFMIEDMKRGGIKMELSKK